MSSIEKKAKESFSEYFKPKSWERFKMVAESYLKRAVYSKKSDIPPMKENKQMVLLIRNIQKRLDIGIGVELLVKSFYLKKRYIINQYDKSQHDKSMNDIQRFSCESNNPFKGFSKDKTLSLNNLIQNMDKIKKFEKKDQINIGFRIAKVFRNKEGHSVSSKHKYDPEDYCKIETSLKCFYKEAFDENLEVQFSMEANEKGVWKVTPAEKN